ncbi:hypothetical protein IVB30_37635 [Bradyrhizobium sp. 200]|uniref:hypothetical protein n=1 Tax=Bradyrhizobium sp. 200 TaxID=2782665 RepID=UPI001FFE66CB|nr:hypothetical protein [Bradyrhizobium sp. 200]UPJ48687.1 hypothetical protein IVB30_37635 [Bradyrhizobium sp. 200]
MPMPEEMTKQEEVEVAEANKLSFDFDVFDKELRTGDMLFMLIRAHLYLEHVLISMILEACKNPEEVSMRNINFPTKVELCIGLGLLRASWREPLLRINRMRNRVAHRLSFEFTEGEKEELIGLLPDQHLLDEAAKEAGLKPEDRVQLEWWRILRVVVVWLDIVRQRHQEGRVREKFAQLNLRRVLDMGKTGRTSDIQK